jgi:hypothetical protein
MEPCLLTSDAFGTQREKEEVPQWRDGKFGHELQRNMVRHLHERFFEHGFLKTSDRPQAVFASATHWVSFSRLMPHLHALIEGKFGARGSWPDSVVSLHREIWRGEHDKEFAKLSATLPANLDTTPMVMQKRIEEMFSPIARVLRGLLEAQALETAGFKGNQEEKNEDLEAKTETKSGTAPEEMEGDVTDAVAKQATAKEKAELVAKLNKDAKIKRESEMRSLIQAEAAGLLRNRLIVSSNVEQLKSYMESTQGGLVARSIVIDGTMPKNRQSGDKSRQVCLALNKTQQEELAVAVKKIPATPVLGNVVIRHAGHSIDKLEEMLKNTHSHKRSVVVPVSVPEAAMRYVRSGVRRSNGPTDDESSGIDFVIRTIGKRRIDEETGKDLEETKRGAGGAVGADGPGAEGADDEGTSCDEEEEDGGDDKDGR